MWSDLRIKKGGEIHRNSYHSFYVVEGVCLFGSNFKLLKSESGSMMDNTSSIFSEAWIRKFK
jgi:hypothetical protein